MTVAQRKENLAHNIDNFFIMRGFDFFQAIFLLFLANYLKEWITNPLHLRGL